MNENTPWIRRPKGCFTAVLQRCRRRPTLPRSRERSTIGAVGLNDRVRNGNECGPYALVASDMETMVGLVDRNSSNSLVRIVLLCLQLLAVPEKLGSSQ